MDLAKHAAANKEKGIDLEKEGGNKSIFPTLKKPLKNAIFSPVAFERYETSGKGTPALMIRFVVLDGEEIGKTIDADLYLTGNMLDLGNLALSIGAPEEPFDENDDEAISTIITKYYPTVRASAIDEPYEGKSRLKLKYFGKAPADKRSDEFVEQDAQKEAFNNAADEWDGYLEWRAKNPRKAPGSGGGSGGGGQQQTTSRHAGNAGNGGGGYGGGGYGGGGGSQSSGSDDDIPF